MSQTANNGRIPDHIQLSAKQQNDLLQLAREAISCYLNGQPLPKLGATVAELEQNVGVFVTVRCHTAKGLLLRGCIGQIETTLPLYKSVSEMAVKASTNDPRFPPITKDELGNLHISISVLSKLVPLLAPEAYELGKHGLLIEGYGRRGLLLPEVPLNHNWNKVEFLAALCRKAGLPLDAWRSSQVKLFAFTTLEFEESLV